MEANILLWIQENLRAEWLTPIVKFITTLGNAGILWILISLVLLILPKTRKIGLATSLSLIFDLLAVNILIKRIVARVRPYEVIEGLTSLIGPQSDFSFPSGHTAASFAFATVILIFAPKKYSLPTLVLAFLIAFSRLYLGVHYPTDVLGGIVIGALCGVAAACVVKFIEKKKATR